MSMQASAKILLSIIIAGLLFNLTGCATTPANPEDPYEAINRPIFKFDYALDKAILRPVARTYTNVVPTYAQARFTNFFSNLDEIPSTANDALQLDVYHTFSDGSRFLVNSTLGILGLWDPASHMQLPDHHNDLGLTMARWGLIKSPYIVLPFLGPSTLRDAVGSAGNTFMTPYAYVSDWIVYPVWGAQKVVQRAAILPADKLVDDAFDPYIFVRDAYLQNRDSRISQLPGPFAKQVPATSSSGSSNQDTGDTYVPDDSGTHANSASKTKHANNSATKNNQAATKANIVTEQTAQNQQKTAINDAKATLPVPAEKIN